jgi:glycosyltransferase involved in cell wall biosynthesis
MKRLLIISANFPPSVSIGTRRIIRLCKYLDSSRWSVSVLTLKEKYYPVPPNGVKNGRPKLLENVNVYRTEKLDLVFLLLNWRDKIRAKLRKNNQPVSSHPAEQENVSPAQQNTPGSSSKKGLWQSLKDFFTDIFQFPDKHISWLPLAVWKGWKIIRRDKIDVVFSSSPSHSVHLISTILKVLTRKKLVIDFRDPWARSTWEEEERVDNTYERWKHGRITRMEKWVVSQADEVILVTREMRNDFVRSYPQLPPHKFNYFPNGYDPENVLSLTPALNSNGVKPSKTVFVHAGSLYKFRDPTPILYALKNLLESGAIETDKIVFQFIGVITSHLAHIPALAEKLQINDVVQFLPPVSYQKAMEYMAESHVLILLQPLTKLQLPGKFFDYLCLGKPVLAVAEKDSATERIVKDGYGVFADFNNVKDVEKAILFLYQHPYYNIEFIRENRNVFDMSKSIENFMAILDS